MEEWYLTLDWFGVNNPYHDQWLYCQRDKRDQGHCGDMLTAIIPLYTAENLADQFRKNHIMHLKKGGRNIWLVFNTDTDDWGSPRW